jgi:hypothetical protein
MPRQTIIRWWFIGLLPLLAAQFYFARRVSEPYPAIIFPGFTKVPVHQNYPYDYEYLRIVGHAGGDSVLLTLNDVLAPVPYKAKVFYPNMIEKMKELVSISDSSRHQELAWYIRQNLKNNANRTFERITLRWYQYRATSPRDTHPVRLASQQSINLTTP